MHILVTYKEKWTLKVSSQHKLPQMQLRAPCKFVFSKTPEYFTRLLCYLSHSKQCNVLM